MNKNKYKTEFWTVDDGSEGELEHEDVHRAVMAWLENTPVQEWPTRLQLIGHKYKPSDESDFAPSGEKSTVVVRAWVRKHRPKWIEAMDMCKTATSISTRLRRLCNKVNNYSTRPVYEIEHELREIASKLSAIARIS